MVTIKSFVEEFYEELLQRNNPRFHYRDDVKRPCTHARGCTASRARPAAGNPGFFVTHLAPGRALSMSVVLS